MSERNLTKAVFMTVVESDKCEPTQGVRSQIYTVWQYFTPRHKHRKGSNRPAGYFHTGIGSFDAQVTVRWLWTEENGFFAPEITFRPSGRRTANQVAKALAKVERKDGGPENLSEALGATVVEYVNDNAPGCYDDYRPIRVPGEPAMVTLARAAL